ncbi:MAG: hypothetical protein ABEJ98_00910 [Candidatus Nanohaloarchaea archaeon]
MGEEADEPEEAVEESPGKGFVCVNCETEVKVDPVDDKIICPKCSHRVLLKNRPEQPKKVEAI